MPNVDVIKRVLFEMIGQDFSKRLTQADEEFEDLCFEYGLEMEVIDTKNMADRFKELTDEEEEAYKIEVPANRYDLLCVEGIVQAIKAYLQIGEAPEYTITSPEKPV